MRPWPCAALSAEDPQLLGEIEFVKTPLSVNPLYVTAGLQNPKAQEVFAALNRGLEIIKAHGIYDSIIKKYSMKGESLPPNRLTSPLHSGSNCEQHLS